MSAIIPKQSAGILLYRRRNEILEVFLVHPGGPYWAKKDQYAWSIPKGEFGESEDPRDSALREFQEETGFALEINSDKLLELTPVKQRGGKVVHAWAVEGDLDANSIASNTFSMEWPPNSGQQQEFPEVDRAGWFDVETARDKLIKAQSSLIDELIKLLTQSYSAW